MYFADLDPVVGSEQGGIRPVLVIQNDIGNHYSPTVIVAAITGRRKKQLPTHVRITDAEGLYKSSFVMLEQIRTIDKERLKECIGRLNEQKMREVNNAIWISLGVVEYA